MASNKTKTRRSVRDADINFSDIPLQRPGSDWQRGTVTAGPLRNPQLVVTLAPDVTRWVESLGKLASRRVNSILRVAMKAAR